MTSAWVLMVVFSWAQSGSAITTDFATEGQCLAAKKQVLEDVAVTNPNVRIVAKCLEK